MTILTNNWKNGQDKDMKSSYWVIFTNHWVRIFMALPESAQNGT
jgi:hypothetical protein